jgi:hypothetical protein
MIPIGIKNLTANTLYVKELQVEVSGNQTFFLGTYDFFDLAAAESLKDFINAGSAVIIRDGVQLSQADSLAYVTTPSSGGGGEVNTASNVGTGTEVFKQKVGVDLEFRKINSTELNVTQNTNDITLSANSALISGQSSVTPAAGMEVLVNDSGTLKKGDVSSFLGASFENNYVNTSLFNPTVGAFATNGGQGANTLVGYCYAIHGQVTIDGLTITSAGGGGNLATAIYKYDSATAKFNKIASTETNSWNMGVSGFQTVSITQTTLDQGIYLNVVSTDTGRGSMSAYNQPKMDTPLGRVAAGTQIMGITRGSVTYTYPMISQLDSIGTGYWNEGTNFFGKFSSFLLNEV